MHQIEKAVSQLSPEEIAAFRAWFAEFDAAVWERQFESDVAAGRLDALEQNTDLVWLWIGPHAEYDKLLGA